MPIMKKWCSGPESNRYALRRGIFVTLRLSPPAIGRSCAGLCLDRAIALGPRRLVSTPSPVWGLARRYLSHDWPGDSPNLTGFTRVLSPPGAQFSKSLVSTYFTTRAHLRFYLCA